MKTVFITGTSTGIGKEAVYLFAEKGWNVIATMRNLNDAKTFAPCKSVLFLECDVTDDKSVKNAVNHALATFGQIDVLVNNAGIYNTKPLESTTNNEIDQIINTNIKGVILCTQTLLPHFREKMNGIVINISSVAGFAAFPFQTIYHASKWGIEGLSESLGYELKKFNIKVKIVEPGVVKTPLYDDIMSNDETIHPDYQETFTTWHNHLLNNIKKGAMPKTSAETIYKAATDNSWKLRYRSGLDTKLAALLRFLLPLRTFRFIIGKMTGIS